MARTKPVPAKPKRTRRRTTPDSTKLVGAPVRRRTSPTSDPSPARKIAGTPRKGPKVITAFTEFFHNWGGCLPFVNPDDCPHPRRFQHEQTDGIVYWIDNGICKLACPNGKKHCPRYEDYWKRGGGKVAHSNFIKQRFIAAGACNGCS